MLSNLLQVLGERNGASGPTAKKTVEEIYQKKTQLEHILLRPDTYIGSVEKMTQPMLVVEAGEDGEPSFRQRDITYVPGLFKIFDEIIGAFESASTARMNESVERKRLSV